MDIIKTLPKYIKIHFLFMKNCLISQMEYRLNFFMGIVLDLAFFFSKFIYAIIIYNSDSSIGGLSGDEVLLFIGTFSIITGIYVSFFLVNFYVMIPGYIRNGQLDIYMTKPISLQFIVSTRYVEFPTIIPDIVGGIILVCTAWRRIGIPISAVNILGYAVFVAGGTLVAYSIFLMIQTLAFFITDTKSLSQISNSLWDFNKMTMKIYNKMIQVIGVFILPVFVISNFAPLFLLKKLNNIYIIWGIIIPVVLLYMSRCFWNFGLKRYSSAN